MSTVCSALRSAHAYWNTDRVLTGCLRIDMDLRVQAKMVVLGFFIKNGNIESFGLGPW